MLAQPSLRAALSRSDAQPGREQQVVQLFQRMALVALHAREQEVRLGARGVAQALVDRRLPDAPEGVRVGAALAGFGGDELARLDPRCRLGLRQQGHCVEPGDRLRQQVLAPAGFAGQRFQRRFVARRACGVAAFGDVDAGTERLRLRCRQVRQQGARRGELLAEQQGLGQAVVQGLGHRRGRCAHSVEQPVEQGRFVGLRVAAEVGQQVAGQPHRIGWVQAGQQLAVERCEQRLAQRRLAEDAGADEAAEAVERGGAAPAMHHHAHRARISGAVENRNVVAAVELVLLAPGAPPEFAAGLVEHDGAKALPAGVALGCPAATLVVHGMALPRQFAERQTHVVGVKGAAARGAQAGQRDQVDQLGDGQRRLCEGQCVEHRGVVGQQGRQGGGLGHRDRQCRHRPRHDPRLADAARIGRQSRPRRATP